MKKLFCLFCLILLTNIVFCQVSDWKKPLDSNFAQMYFHPADYIFEGTLEEYSVQNIKNVPFYVSKIKVTKVFKGQLVITNKIVVYQKTNDKSDFSSDLYIEQENIKLKKEVLTRKNLSALYICNKKIDNSIKGKTENIYIREGFRYLLDYDGKIGDPSTGYGYQYDTPEERNYMLLLICGAITKGEQQREIDLELELLGEKIDKNIVIDLDLEKQIKATANILSDALLTAKFIQGIPILGIIGGAVNYNIVNKIGNYAGLKYKKRYLLKRVIE